MELRPITKRNFKDMTGQRFERLVVISAVGTDGNSVHWKCKCDCGTEKVIRGHSLRMKMIKSCGCFHRDKVSETSKKHGMCKSHEYNCWAMMKSRCNSKTATAYDRYGGRGISVCERWLEFDNFIADMGLAPSPKHTIERMCNDGNYEPGNCKWATRKEQSRNKSNVMLVDYQGERLMFTELAEKCGKNSKMLYRRIKVMGWSVEKAVSTPSMQRRVKKGHEYVS